MQISNLKTYIKKSGLTQSEIAEKLDMDASTFNLKLNESNNRVFSVYEAFELSEILNIPIEKRSDIFFAHELAETQA